MSDKDISDLENRLKNLKTPSSKIEPPSLEERYSRLNPTNSQFLFNKDKKYKQSLILGSPEVSEEEQVNSLLQQSLESNMIKENDQNNELMMKYKKLNPNGYSVSNMASKNDVENYDIGDEDQQVNDLLKQVEDSIQMENQLGNSDVEKENQNMEKIIANQKRIHGEDIKIDDDDMDIMKKVMKKKKKKGLFGLFGKKKKRKGKKKRVIEIEISDSDDDDDSDLSD